MKQVSFCPRCHSIKIKRDVTNPLEPDMGLPARYYCDICGHAASIFPTIQSDQLSKLKVKQVKKLVVEPAVTFEIKTKQKVVRKRVVAPDVTYGLFELEYIFKITGPIGIASGFVLLFADVGVAGWWFIFFGIMTTWLGFRKRK